MNNLNTEHATQSPYTEGKWAFWAGDDRYSNPHEKESFEYKEWSYGWIEAQVDFTTASIHRII